VSLSTLGSRLVVAVSTTQQLTHDRVYFVETDVTSFNSQAAAFKAASSPTGSLDIVIPCAGLMGQPILENVDPSKEPTEPSTRIFDVNLIAVYYTANLALHYFTRQSQQSKVTSGHLPQLILISSLMAYAPAPLQSAYNATKHGVRGLWKSLKDGESPVGMRTNLIAPTLCRTPMTALFCDHLQAHGFAVTEVSDVVKAMMTIACDESVKGRAIAPGPNGELIDLCDDFEGLDGGRETLKVLESGMVGRGPKELGMFKFA
jgi:5'-hydroxyaverantin dehydrogenase